MTENTSYLCCVSFIAIAGTTVKGSSGRSRDTHIAYITPALKEHWRNNSPYPTKQNHLFLSPGLREGVLWSLDLQGHPYSVHYSSTEETLT